MSEPDRQYAMTFHPEASEPYLLQNTGLQPAGPGRHTGIMISVIRSPATRKAGRLDAYGAAQQAAA